MSGLIQNELVDNLQGIADLLSQRKTAADEQARPLKFSTETGDDGQLLTTVTAPHEEILKIQEKMKLLDQILGSFHERSSMLQAQEAQKRQENPILAALGSVAGHLATGDKRLPPIVAALGKANLEMNPSQQVLGQRAQEASMAEAAVAKEQAGLARESLALQLHEKQIDEANQAKTEMRVLARAKQDDLNIQHALQEARLNAKTGTPMTEAAFNGLMKTRKIDPAKWHDAYVAHQLEAAGVAEKIKQDHAAALDKIRESSAARASLEETKGDVRIRVGKELENYKELNRERLIPLRVAAQSGLRKDSEEVRAYQKVQPRVEAVLNVKDSSGRLRQLIKDHPEAVGVIEGRIPEWAITRDQAMVRAEFFTLLDAVRQQIQGGTRFWNPQEFQNLSPKLAAAKKTERVNLGILDALEDFANRQARNTVRASKAVPWDKVGTEVWGAYKDEIFGAASGSGAVNPEQPNVFRGGPKAAPSDNDPLGIR